MFAIDPLPNERFLAEVSVAQDLLHRVGGATDVRERQPGSGGHLLEGDVRD
jgi:hypothetical protein